MLGSGNVHCQSGGKLAVCSARYAVILGADFRKHIAHGMCKPRCLENSAQLNLRVVAT